MGSRCGRSTFRGDLTEYKSETHEELVTQVGEGITGYAAITGQTYYAPDALHDERGWQIEGTDEIDESLLAVPLKVGDKVTGVIVLSNLGTDQFDEEDQRVLEVLASHAAVAYENASLLQKEREAAKTSSALLGLSQALSGPRTSPASRARRAAVPSIIDGSAVAAYRRDPKTGDFALVHQRGLPAERTATTRRSRPRSRAVPPLVRGAIRDRTGGRRACPSEFWLVDEPSDVLVAPMRWEPDEFGALAMVTGADSSPSPSETAIWRAGSPRSPRSRWAALGG